MIDDVIRLISSPHFWALIKLLFGYWVFSALIGTIKMPSATSPTWWKYTFAFLNAFAANVNRGAVALKIPGAAPPSP